MPIEIKSTVSKPIKIGPKTYEHTFYVLIEAASDCLLGLDFLETNKCDALFSEGKLKIDRNTLVPFYRKQFSFIRESLNSTTPCFDCARQNPRSESATSSESRFV